MHIQVEIFPMLYSLTGELLDTRELSFLLKTGAIVWHIQTSKHSIAEFRRMQQPVTVLTYLYHREDQLQLFGFASIEGRHAFSELLRVSGIGPKQALKVLSHITAQQLWSAIESRDERQLTSVPGLGKKMVEKLILAMKDRIPEYVYPSEIRQDNRSEDIMHALVDMGYQRQEVAKQMHILQQDTEFTKLHESEIFKIILENLGLQ